MHQREDAVAPRGRGTARRGREELPHFADHAGIPQSGNGRGTIAGAGQRLRVEAQAADGRKAVAQFMDDSDVRRRKP